MRKECINITKQKATYDVALENSGHIRTCITYSLIYVYYLHANVFIREAIWTSSFIKGFDRFLLLIETNSTMWYRTCIKDLLKSTKIEHVLPLQFICC